MLVTNLVGVGTDPAGCVVVVDSRTVDVKRVALEIDRAALSVGAITIVEVAAVPAQGSIARQVAARNDYVAGRADTGEAAAVSIEGSVFVYDDRRPSLVPGNPGPRRW